MVIYTGFLYVFLFRSTMKVSIRNYTCAIRQVYLYADDTKLFQPIRTPEDSKQLQHALSCTADWSNDCNLKFNSSKCKVLTISRRKHPFQTSYHLETELQSVVREVDLGITVTSNLSWIAHIKDLVSKANKMLGLL